MSDTSRLAQITAIYDVRRRLAERKTALAVAAAAKAERDADAVAQAARRIELQELARIRDARSGLLAAPFTRETASQVRRTVELAFAAISSAQTDASQTAELRARLNRIRSQLARDLQKRIVKHDSSVERLRQSKMKDQQAAERRAVDEYVESRATATARADGMRDSA